MAQVKRFFHVRQKNDPRNGATVLVTGEEDGGPVRVQIAYCSPNDQFCRKNGREQAEKSGIITIPLKGLPGLLHKVAKKVMRKSKFYATPLEIKQMGVFFAQPAKNWRQISELWTRDWSFSTKYWTPRIAAADNPEVGHEAPVNLH